MTISQSEMLRLSQFYSQLYERYIARLSIRLVNELSIAECAARVLVRRALVPLIHCFVDRLVRVGKAIGCAPGQLAVPRQKLFPTLDTIEAFEECAVASPAFNQSTVWFVGRIWQLPEIDPAPEQLPYTSQVGFKNNLFRLYSRTPWRLVKKIWLQLLSRLPISRFPTLTMANAQGALFEHGFYSHYFEDISPRWPLILGSIDSRLRESFFSDDLIDTPELDDFLTSAGLNSTERIRSRSLLKEFLQFYYPPSLLESIPQNMEQASQSLKKFKKRTLISSSGRCSRSTYVVAAAKVRSFSVVDHQHGGHYGYIEDASSILELEYPGVDQFVSWGWSRLPDHDAFRSLSVVGLPSPWLSERKRYWSRSGIKIGGMKEFDFLLMPNMVKRFPPAPHGSSTSRVDLIQEFAASLKLLVSKATEKGIRILHKPYNTTTVNLLAKTMQELESIGRSRYLCLQELHKGLTPELVQRCHMILWDQPGTGFLECLVSGIPTLVCWPRTYNQEEEWVKPAFAELERVGVVHRSVDTLLEEVERFKKSPEGWVNDPERVSVIARFCREFAWASDDWPKYWRQYLDGLSGHDGVTNEQ